MASVEGAIDGAPKASLLLMSLAALGIVFGDIGTSPLYKQPRVFVFFKDETSALGSDEQVEAFKAEKGVGPHDTLVTVVFTFA